MEIGKIEQVNIENEMRTAYLDYAMSVIVARALPDARDGLKPVHRRILYAMYDMGIRANTSHRKSARIVGEVLGKYHPHSDTAVYEAMARMAQDFSMRYPLVDGQGNFGSIGGDPPAAMRYTEARMSRIAEEMLVDINKNTVDFLDNFDASEQEPSVLPSRLPNLLLNGSSGIAVGMASNIPPHNLGELAAAIDYMIDHYDNVDEITIEDLLNFVKGPDFPTGGIIVGTEGIRQMYSSGRGRLTVRGKARIEEMSNNRYRIVIAEIPYQLNQTTLIERIAELARGGRLEGVSDLRDESDRNGMSIILELRRGAQPRTVLNRLYKYTPLQTTFGAQILALVDNEPRLLSLKRALQIFIEHRREVITRRTQYDLEKARARAHILEGLLIALANLDEVIKTIRESADVDTARERLMARFKLSELQAQAILDMQLRRLAALERQKIEDEYKEVTEEINYLEDLLAHPKKILAVIKEDLSELNEKYGDERRTIIDLEASGELSEEDLVKPEAVLISITGRGYVKRVAAKSYRAQGRGGRGVKGHTTKDEDEVMMLIPANSLDTILFFSNRGKVYSERAYNIPDADRTARGTPIINILGIDGNETITAAVRVVDFKDAANCAMATRKGIIKRVELSEFESVRPSGLIAMNLDEDDMLGWARLTTGEDHIILVTEKGQAVRFPEEQVRTMGRQARGVKGISIKADDLLTSMEVVEPGGDLLIVTTKGYGKRTPLEKYPAKSRGTKGVRTIDAKAVPIVGRICSARVVQESDDLTIIS
ncbi:MAG: DNA gyrase subunit A, partial [Anaerolineales bacterium]|nr:DNA gyrase subunit A [Anaerolineales bacterium]